MCLGEKRQKKKEETKSGSGLYKKSPPKVLTFQQIEKPTEFILLS